MSPQHTRPASSTPPVPEPSLAERARTLVRLGRIGSLSTHSERQEGFPFGSMMPYAADEQGEPVFFVSNMAMHTQNMQRDPRISLLVTEANVSGDPLGSARLTLLGSVSRTDDGAMRELYLNRHENARYWQDFTDFAFYQLKVTGVYFIGGFGVMGWVDPEEYRHAKPDPLADSATGIIEHMNADHADALISIARHFAQVIAQEAQMTAVDRLGFYLRLKTEERTFGQRIAFVQEVGTSAEVRQVLIEMLKQARG